MIKQRIKILLGVIVFSLRLHRLLLRNRAVIVAFHSVNDEALRSDINCTPALFRKYCEFFKRYFNVTTLDALLDRIRNQQSIDGYLVITFDDGYSDNSEIAAPILSGLGLPATFFVTTGFIDSDRVAPWDADIGIQSRWMSWADVIDLHGQGFEIGGHTINHVSLADTPEDTARVELTESRATLLEKIGGPVRNFAYPFGGKDNFSAECVPLVQDAGFESCMSCHGGTVSNGDDVFALRRAPITSRHVSPYDFAFDCVLGVIRAEEPDHGYS